MGVTSTYPMDGATHRSGAFWTATLRGDGYSPSTDALEVQPSASAAITPQ